MTHDNKGLTKAHLTHLIFYYIAQFGDGWPLLAIADALRQHHKPLLIQAADLLERHARGGVNG